MSLVEPFTVTHELDQMLVQYRKHLQRLGQLWAQVADLGCYGNVVASPRSADDMLSRLELAVTGLMERGVQVENIKQEVLDLKAALDISRQTVEAKSKHLGQEEKQKEEEQSLRFKEFKRIHRYQEEKAALEKELVPAKRRLAQISEILDEKSEKIRNLEHFYDALSDHCEQGMTSIRQQTELARFDRAKWDKLDLDIGQEVSEFPLDKERLDSLEQNVRELSTMIQHHKQWYEEEMQTKLFYSTRSKEIKHKLAYFRSVLRRVENSGRNDDTCIAESELDGRRLGMRSENILVDGSPGVQAKDVENYLSRQFGMRVLADYTMLKRLKDEIGVQGLAYLVEKVRLQGQSPGASQTSSTSGIVTSVPAFSDWEEQRVEQALMGIAMEYRQSEEGKRLGQHRLPPTSPANESKTSNASTSTFQSPRRSSPVSSKPSPASRVSTAPSLNSLPVAVAASGSHGSSSSLRRKSSMARLRRLFKF